MLALAGAWRLGPLVLGVGRVDGDARVLERLRRVLALARGRLRLRGRAEAVRQGVAGLEVGVEDARRVVDHVRALVGARLRVAPRVARLPARDHLLRARVAGPHVPGRVHEERVARRGDGKRRLVVALAPERRAPEVADEHRVQIADDVRGAVALHVHDEHAGVDVLGLGPEAELGHEGVAELEARLVGRALRRAPLRGRDELLLVERRRHEGRDVVVGERVHVQEHGAAHAQGEQGQVGEEARVVAHGPRELRAVDGVAVLAAAEELEDALHAARVVAGVLGEVHEGHARGERRVSRGRARPVGAGGEERRQAPPRAHGEPGPVQVAADGADDRRAERGRELVERRLGDRQHEREPQRRRVRRRVDDARQRRDGGEGVVHEPGRRVQRVDDGRVVLVRLEERRARRQGAAQAERGDEEAQHFWARRAARGVGKSCARVARRYAWLVARV
mmetsp:Transcript_8663/g.28439  ORF Transcript_8663/g.28439 Transcript_8663/m.28439 type:complete len:450 (+) Transcript_8663:72-1421(+)